MTARRLLLGDWHPWMRDPIDVLRALLVLGAVGFGVGGDGRAASLLGAAGVLAWLVRPVWLPRAYDLALVLALSLQAWGEALRLYDSVEWFDNIVHFTLPFFAGPTLYVVLARLDVVPDPKDETHLRHYVGIAVIAFSLGMSMGGLWEMWEWASDRWLGTDLQIDNDDTVGDLTADSLGSLFGAFMLVIWARWGWGSVRRIPGTNVREDTQAG